MKRKLSIVLFCVLVAALAAALTACGLFGLSGKDKKNNTTEKVNVADMPVKGTIEGEVYYDPEQNGIVWGAVEGADYYLVKFGCDDSERKFGSNFAGNTFFVGDNVFYVFAVRKNNTKTEVKSQEFYKTPLNLVLDKANDSVTWTGDENASGYKISIVNADVKNARSEFTVAADATSAPLAFIEPNYRYFVSVSSLMTKGTHLPADASLSNIRRVKKETFYYNGYTHSFMGFPDPIPGEDATYTNHITIGDDAQEFSGRSLSYQPTGGDFTASAYTESNRSNYLNSVKQTITVTEKAPVTNLACDENGTLTWSEAESASGYRLSVNGVDTAGSFVNSIDVSRVLVVGAFGEISVTPYFYENAYSTASDPISVFRRGSTLKLEFFSYEPNFGEVGENRFTVTSQAADTQLKGVTFHVSGAETLTHDSNFGVQGEVRNTTLTYNGFRFETAGTYTVTVSPRYELPAGTISVGEDSSASYTVTRLPDLISAEVRNVDGNGKIFVEGATGGYVEIIDKSTGNKLSRSQPGRSGAEYYFNLFEWNNTATITRTFSYSLYNVAYKIGTYEYNSWERSGLQSMTLRSLGKADVSYRLVGRVNGITYNATNNAISWGYGEAATFTVLDVADGIRIHGLSATSLDLTSYINNGVFSDEATHTISVSVEADPDHGLFFSSSLSKSLRGTPAPVLTLNSDDTLDYLHISNNKGWCTMKTTYAVGPKAGQTITANEWYFTANHDGATIEIRNDGFWDSKNGIQYVNSPWVTYTVTTPQATDPGITCNSDKTVSWRAVEHVSSYKYVISGDGEASGDRVTNPKTANISSILTGRKTYSITVSGYGSQDGNTFYLPTELLTDTFYCSSWEVWALDNGVPNTESNYTTRQTAIQFRLKIVPDGSELPFVSCNVTIKDSNKPAEIYYYAPTAYVGATYDCTTAITTQPIRAEHPFVYYMNIVGTRHANITFSLTNGMESMMLPQKSFLDKSSVVFALYKDYNDHSKYDIRYTSSN